VSIIRGPSPVAGAGIKSKNKTNCKMDHTSDIRKLNERIEGESAFVDIIRTEMNKVIIGQKHLTDSLLIGLLTNGHILIEGVPGLAKTLAISTLASIIDARFSRIQFTPDLLPADLIGTMIYSQKKEEFLVRKGPVFANFILADEVNRSPAKVQSALLEAMQERQVTIGDYTYPLDDPFMVLATQNPIEQEGTYPLPEAQVDRFMLKVLITYPEFEEEKLIVRENLAAEFPKVNTALSTADILKARSVVREVYMDEKIENYILSIVFATREPGRFGLESIKPMISYGSSPRASINLALAAKAYAFIRRRGYVVPEDVRNVCFDVMRHRIGLTYEAEAELVTADSIITEILNSVEVP
jgi:MoxR-like ATPase